MKAQNLKKIPLFRELSDRYLERLAGWADEIEIPAGKQLMGQGNFPHEFMVMSRGAAEVIHDGTLLATLGPGDFFGEIALLEDQRRMATVTTTTDSSIIVMHARDFRAMEDAMPEVANRIRTVMEERQQHDHELGIDG